MTLGSARQLGLYRAGFWGLLLVLYGAQDVAIIATLAELYWRPVSFVAWLLPSGPPSASVLSGFQIVWCVAALCAALGLYTRISSALACGLGLFLLALPYGVSRMSHELAACAIASIGLALAPAGDGFSLDRLRRKNAVADSEEHRWPVLFVRLVISTAFFAAGVSKLRHGGLEWITSDNLQLLLGQREQPLGLWLAESPLVCRALAGATIAIELFHPLSLWSKKAAWLWVPGGVMILLGSWLLLGVPFWPLLGLHLFWLPTRPIAEPRRP